MLTLGSGRSSILNTVVEVVKKAVDVTTNNPQGIGTFVRLSSRCHQSKVNDLIR